MSCRITDRGRKRTRGSRKKLIDLAGWISGVARTSCDTCRGVYEIAGEEPPCEKCCPGVHRRNETAIAIWPMVSGQWRSSMSGIQDIDLCAIEIAERQFGIAEEDRLILTKQLLKIGRVIVEEIQRDQEIKNLRKAK